MSSRIFHVDNIKASRVSVPGLDGPDSPKISSSGDHAEVTSVKLDPVLDLSGRELDLDGITDLAVRIGVADGSPVVGAEERDAVLTDGDKLYSAEFIAGFVFVDPVDAESPFGVINKPKVLAGFVDGEHVHESSGELDIGPDLTVDLDLLGHDNLLELFAVQGVVQAVSEKDSEWHALSELVWPGVWSKGKDTPGLGEHPVVWRIEGFKMLFRSAASHDIFCLCESVSST